MYYLFIMCLPLPCFPYNFCSHSSSLGSEAGGDIMVRGGFTGGVESERRKNSPPAKFSNEPLRGVEFAPISSE